MTTLEIILIAIIWIAYGCFNATQMDKTSKNEEETLGCFVLSIAFSPVFILIRLIWGIFTSKFW
jgi:hypothetical protein